MLVAPNEVYILVIPHYKYRLIHISIPKMCLDLTNKKNTGAILPYRLVEGDTRYKRDTKLG